MPTWRPIEEARTVRDYTVADLRMASGRVYRACWKPRGRCTAWWPEPGQPRSRAIALYEPVAFLVIAAGMGLL